LKEKVGNIKLDERENSHEKNNLGGDGFGLVGDGGGYSLGGRAGEKDTPSDEDPIPANGKKFALSEYHGEPGDRGIG
jgi:hypothetical protein